MASLLISKTESFVRSIQAPEKTRTYTPISHGGVIDIVKESLHKKGLLIRDDQYRTTKNGNVLQAIYKLDHSTDPDLGMMFAFANSYDKTMKFKCAVGAYVFVCDNGMLRGDIDNYARKHNSGADVEIYHQLDQQLNKAENYYNDIIMDRNIMKDIVLSEGDSRAIVSELFFKEDLLTTEQLSIIKKEFYNPSFQYGCDKDALWANYQHITHALKTTHPRDYMTNQQKIHSFINKKFEISEKRTESILSI